MHRKTLAFVTAIVLLADLLLIVSAVSTLSNRHITNAGNNPNSLAIRDLNGDGYNDLLSADEGSNVISLYLFNATTEDFDPRISLDAGDGPVDADAGNLDGIGSEDIAYVSVNDDTVGMYRFNGSSGQWDAGGESVISGGFVRPRCLELCDMDMDGIDEAVVGTAGSDEVIVLKWNVTAGNWTELQRIGVPAHPGDLRTGNLTGDEYPDVAVVSHDADKITILVGSQGGLAPGQQISGGDGPVAVDLGDLDGDGDQDIAAASKNEANITYYYNQQGEFLDGNKLHCGGNPWDVEIADYDNDGWCDLAVVSGQRLELELYRYDPDMLDFGEAVVRQTGRYPIDVEVTDLDGDGDNDIVVADRNDHTLSVFISNSFPVFHPPAASPFLNEGVDSSQLFIDLLSHFTDVEDEPDELDFSIEAFDQEHNYTAVIKNSRYVTLDCTADCDFCGNMTIAVGAQDPGGNMEIGEFIVRVLPMPDAPVIEKIGNVSVFQANPVFHLDEHEIFTASITASDADGDEVTYTSNITEPGGVEHNERFHLNSTTGTIEFRPERPDIGNLSVCFVVTDSTGLSSHVNAIFSVRDVNDAPVLVGLDEHRFADGKPHFVVVEGFWLNISVLAEDPEGDPLTYSIKGAPYSMNVDDRSGRISFLPTQADMDRSVDYTVKLTVEDDGGLNDTEEFTLSLIDVNTAPVIGVHHVSPPSHPDAYDIGETIMLSVEAVDPDGDSINISWYVAGIDDVLGHGPNLTYSFETEGDHVIRAVVEDGRGKNTTWEFRIKVTMFNHPPRIVGNDVKHTAASDHYEVSYKGVDPDGDALTWALVTNCSWLNISDTGVLSGDAPDNVSGMEYAVLVILTDGNGARDEREFVLKVREEDGDDGPGDNEKGEGKNGGLAFIMIYLGVGMAAILALAIMVVMSIGRKKRMEREKEEQEENDEDYAEIEDTDREVKCPSCGLQLKGLDERYSRECPNCGFERW